MIIQNNVVCFIVENPSQCYCLPEWKVERCDQIQQSDTNDETEVVGSLNGGICKFENSIYSCPLTRYTYWKTMSRNQIRFF